MIVSLRTACAVVVTCLAACLGLVALAGPAAADAVNSTTTLTPPTGKVVTGWPAKLSATVTATGLASTATATGAVQFFDGTTQLTTDPATVSVTGLTSASAGITVTANVTFTTASSSSVSHSITAKFVPADATVLN